MSIYQKYFEKNKGKVFPIYAYSPPHEGKWWIDDTYYYTEDFRTVERYKEYKESGCNVLFMQRTADYKGEEWATCDAKRCIERAVQAGIEKVILVDDRIFRLSMVEGGLIGEGKKFPTEDALDEYIRDCMKDYRKEKGFYGVQLMDEPFHPLLKSIGEIFHSIRRIDKNIFVHCNLNPLVLPTLNFRISPFGKNMVDAYENYLTMFLEETDADYIMVDVYPYVRSAEKAYISRYYFASLEAAARVCKKFGKELHLVMQSFAMNIGKKPHHILPNARMFEYQKNAAIAFGVKEFSYFTYWTKQANRSDGEMFIDGKAMISRNGEKTKTYYNVQKVNKELTELAPLLWQFNFVSNAFFCKPPLFTRPTFLDMVRGGELSQVKNVEIDKEMVLVSEHYDKRKRQYMYCVMNPADPTYYYKKYNEKQHTQLTFDAKYTHADVYEKGKWKTIALQDGKLDVYLNSCYGAIILPYTEG